MNTMFKTETAEEINGLLILLGTKDSMRKLIVDALDRLNPIEVGAYRDSLVKDLNIGVVKPRDMNLEDEI